MQNHSKIAEFLWRIADLIKDDYDAKAYEDVILPFTLLRRLDCVLEPNREAVREAAGQFYTPRDIIRLMVKLLFEPDRDKLAHEKLIGIYDPACGTGGMLTTAKEYLLAAINPEMDNQLFGQEINEKTFTIAKADILMKGGKSRQHQAGKHPQPRPAPRLAV